MERTYQRAGIDVHKSMLAVVAADAGQEGAFQFQRRKFHASQRVRATGGVAAAGACTGSRDGITAQYGKPVWQELEGQCDLSLAQAQFGSAGTGGEPYADPGEERRPGVAGASGRRPTAGGGARIRGGFGHAGDRRSRSHGRQLFHGPRTLLLGGGLRGPGGVCGSIEKQSQSQGQPYATPPTARWLGHEKAIAHRLCRLTWKILQQGVRYLEYGLRLNTKAVQKRARRLLRGVRSLGCQVQITSSPSRA